MKTDEEYQMEVHAAWVASQVEILPVLSQRLANLRKRAKTPGFVREAENKFDSITQLVRGQGIDSPLPLVRFLYSMTILTFISDLEELEKRVTVAG